MFHPPNLYSERKTVPLPASAVNLRSVAGEGKFTAALFSVTERVAQRTGDKKLPAGVFERPTVAGLIAAGLFGVHWRQMRTDSTCKKDGTWLHQQAISL